MIRDLGFEVTQSTEVPQQLNEMINSRRGTTQTRRKKENREFADSRMTLVKLWIASAPIRIRNSFATYSRDSRPIPPAFSRRASRETEQRPPGCKHC